MPNFLNNITFLKDFRCYKKGEEIKLENQVTVITGDNGSGKSTLLSCIRSSFITKWTYSDDPNTENVISTNVTDSKSTEIDYLCFSGDMLANSSSFDDNMDLHLRTMSMSSGQGALEQLIDKVENSKGKPLLILDEPEKGLSEKRINLIFNYLTKHSIDNPTQQIIIVTHSYILMQLSFNVYSTSHKADISTQNYRKWMKESRSLSPFADNINLPKK
jgi:predicted ATPase